MIKEKMQRASKAKPCPVCGKPDWCLVAEDGSAAICQRIQKGSKKQCGDAGCLHILKDMKSARPQSFKIKVDAVIPAAMPILAEQYQDAMTGERYADTSTALSISEASLRRLCVGWDGASYTFPMSDYNGNIIGIRRRFPDGKKLCVVGSRNGIFIPDGLTDTSPLLIVEGNTDCGAGLDLGFDCIGRPNCNSGVDLILRFIKRHPYQSIVVIPDNDTKADGKNPGAVGGYSLAQALRLYCPDIRFVLPPAEHNDLRVWAWSGLTREELLAIIKGTSPIKMEIQK